MQTPVCGAASQVEGDNIHAIRRLDGILPVTEVDIDINYWRQASWR